MEIFVSSSCVRAKTINESVAILAQEGLTNIELSGGTKYYDNYLKDLLVLQDEYELNYRVHNYFPPPLESFMLNLASLNDDLYKQSIDQCKRAIASCKKLGSRKYAVHAGFLIDFLPKEAGTKIGFRPVNDRKVALNRFCEAWKILVDEAGSDVKLYIENNAFSKTNSTTYNKINPFMLTDYESYLELNERIDFNILLDLAHLKVSTSSLGLNFDEQAMMLISQTDYMHVSGNDGLHDQNQSLSEDTEIMNILKRTDLSDKTLTLEVYNGIRSIMESLKSLEQMGG